MKTILKSALVIAIPVFALVFLSTPVLAAGVDVLQGACQGGGNSEVCSSTGTLDDLWQNIANALIFVTGAVAVIMIVVSGFKYASANGDMSQIQGAKATLIYSVAGLILAVAAGGIVNFVLDRL